MIKAGGADPKDIMIKMPNQPVPPPPPPPPPVSSFSSGQSSPPPIPCAAAIPFSDQQTILPDEPRLSVEETEPAPEYTPSTEPDEVNPTKMEVIVAMQVQQSEHDERMQNHEQRRAGEVDDNSSDPQDI